MREVSDEQATTYVFRRVQTRGRGPGVGPRLQPYRRLPFAGGGDSALRRWVKQLQQERDSVTPKSKALTLEQQKIQELEARINRLEREKAILKKATALLMSDELDRTR